MRRFFKTLFALGLFFAPASFALATVTVAPTGPYVPPVQTQQHFNAQVGGSSIHADSNGVDINVSGVGSIKADSSGADINFSGGASENGNEVRVAYRQPGKLFGIIPVQLSAEAVVDASDNISISLPWYSFLVSKDLTAIKTSIAARLAASGASSGSFDDAAKARARAAITASVGNEPSPGLH